MEQERVVGSSHTVPSDPLDVSNLVLLGRSRGA